MRVLQIDHLVLTVRDVPAALAWYTRVLGMEAETFAGADGSIRYAARWGNQKINFHPAGREWKPKAANPAPGSSDLCFLIDCSLDDAAAHLALCGVSVEKGPVARTGATCPITSLYIRDLDGNLIELSVRYAPVQK